MAKRKLKKKNVFLAFIIFLLIIGLCVGGSFLLTNKKEPTKNPNKEIEEPIVEVQKEKRMSLVAVGDALIHAALYLDAQTDYNAETGYYNYDLKFCNQESTIGGSYLGISG